MNAKRGWIGLLLLLVLAACGDGGTEPDASITGRYELRTINGGSLPYTVFQLGGSDRVEITAGHVQINSDATFAITMTSRVIQFGSTSTSTDTSHGTWRRPGDQITFRLADNSVDTAVITDGELRVSSNGLSLVFRK